VTRTGRDALSFVNGVGLGLGLRLGGGLDRGCLD
jgi:hypothetical protein